MCSTADHRPHSVAVQAVTASDTEQHPATSSLHYGSYRLQSRAGNLVSGCCDPPPQPLLDLSICLHLSDSICLSLPPSPPSPITQIVACVSRSSHMVYASCAGREILKQQNPAPPRSSVSLPVCFSQAGGSILSHHHHQLYHHNQPGWHIHLWTRQTTGQMIVWPPVWVMTQHL